MEGYKEKAFDYWLLGGWGQRWDILVFLLTDL